MANARNRNAKVDAGRDPGGFLALPWSVMDSPAFASLSHAARALLLEVARQFVRDNNGRLLLSTAYLRQRGWLSASGIQKAKRELLDAKFIFETVKGQRPNKASWYAVTWRRLDRMPGYDQGTELLFERGAYRTVPGKDKRPAPACKNPRKNPSLIPPDGTIAKAVVPRCGPEERPPIPPHGTVPAPPATRSIPPRGNHLDMPSPGHANVAQSGPPVR